MKLRNVQVFATDKDGKEHLIAESAELQVSVPERKKAPPPDEPGSGAVGESREDSCGKA